MRFTEKNTINFVKHLCEVPVRLIISFMTWPLSHRPRITKCVFNEFTTLHSHTHRCTRPAAASAHRQTPLSTPPDTLPFCNGLPSAIHRPSWQPPPWWGSISWVLRYTWTCWCCVTEEERWMRDWAEDVWGSCQCTCCLLWLCHHCLFIFGSLAWSFSSYQSYPAILQVIWFSRWHIIYRATWWYTRWRVLWTDC